MGTTRRRWVVGTVAGLGIAAAAAAIGHVRADNDTFTGVLRVLEHGVPEVPDIDLTAGPPKTCTDVRAALEAWGLSPTAPLSMKIPGFSIGVEVDEATLTINCGTQNFLAIDGTVKLPRDGQSDLPFAVDLRLDWGSGDDTVPDVTFGATIGGGVVGNVFQLSDALRFADDLIDGFALDDDDLPTDLRLRGVDIGFKWTEADGAWFDVIAATQLRQAPDNVSDTVNVNALLSITPDPGGGAPTVLSGLHADPLLGKTFTLGMMFRGSMGEYLGSIELPEMHMAFVRPEGRTVSLADMPADRPLPGKFFKDSGSELPIEYEYDGDITVSANVALDSFGETVRDTFGYAAGATAQLLGKADITFRDLGRTDHDVVTVNGASLAVTLPELDGTQATLLPDWVKVKQTMFELTWDNESDAFIFEFETGADLTIDDRTQTATGGTVTLSPTLKGEIQVLGEVGGDVITIGMRGEVPGNPASPAWPKPYGLDWLDLHSLGADLVVIAPFGGDSTVELDVKAEVTAAFALGGKSFEARLGFDLRDDRTEFTINLSMNDTIGLSEIMAKFGVTLPSEFDVVIGSEPVEPAADPIEPGAEPAEPVGDPVSITARLSLPADGDAEGSIAVNAPGSIKIGGGTFDVNFLVALETVPGGDYQVIAGARLASTTVENLVAVVDASLASAVGTTPFGAVGLPDVALLFNLESISEPWHRLSPEKQTFFDPLYGCSTNPCDYEVELDAGVHLLSALTMPEDDENPGKPVFDDVFRTFWLDGAPPVLLDLSAPIGSGDSISFSGVNFDMRLPIRPSVDVRPDWFRSASIGIGLRVGTAGVSFELNGDLGIRMRDETRTTAAECSTKHWLATGAGPGDDSPVEACYDVLDFGVKAAVNLGPVPSFTLVGSIQSEGGWRQPFGLPFLEFGGVALQLQVEVPPSGNVSILIGFYVSGKLILDENGLEKDLAGSFVIGLRVVQGPPFVIPEFRGIRIASQAGIELTDVVRLYDIARDQADMVIANLPADEVSPELLQLAALPPLSLDDTGLPNISLRNLELMIGLGEFPDVCIAAGVRLGAELYLGAEPLDGSTIVVETPGNCPDGPIADPIGCLAKEPDPCAAAVSLDVGLNGIHLAGSMNEFDIGPLRWEAAEFEFELRPVSQRMRIKGGASIDGLARGEIDLTIAPTGFAFLGDVELFPPPAPTSTPVFRAMVEGELALDVAAFFAAPTQPPLDFDVHAVLQADFDALMRQLTDPTLTAFRDAVVTLSEIYGGLKATDGDVVQTIKDLPAALRAQGVVVPDWFDDMVDAVTTIDRLIRNAGLEPPTFGQLFAGVPLDEPFTIDGIVTPGFEPLEERCWFFPFVYLVPGTVVDGKCYSVYIDRIPGIADLVDGAPPTFTAFLEDVIEPELTKALRLVGLPTNVTFPELTDAFVARMRSVSVPVKLPCVDFRISTSGPAPGVDLRVRAELFGGQLGLEAAWNFDQPPTNQAVALANTLIHQLFVEPATPECEPIGTTTIGGVLGDGDGLLADTNFAPAVAPDEVAEGGQVTLSGTYGAGLTDATVAEVAWGDGTTESTTVGDLRAGVTHLYVDDDPTGTPADTMTVAVTIGTRTEITLVTVLNVAPHDLELQLGAGIDKGELVPLEGHNGTPFVREGDGVVLVGTFADPGLADTFTGSIRWGDGSISPIDGVELVDAVSGSWRFTAEHVYLDDDPSGTRFDLTTVRVTLSDDDRGTTKASAPIGILNVAPSDVTITPLLGGQDEPERIDEGVEVTYRIDWTDPGVLDTFLVEVDFGDGTVVPVYAEEQTVEVTHTYRDDDPTGTSSDPYTIRATVTDDDTGRGSGTKVVTVYNVDPVVNVQAVAEALTDGELVTQYSDPFGGDPSTGTFSDAIATITAYDVTPDDLTLTATFAGGTFDEAELPGWLGVEFDEDDDCVPDGDFHRTCTWTLVQRPDPVSGIFTDVAPGIYTLGFTVADDDLGGSSATLTFEVRPEDARIWYVGPTFAATTSAKDGSTTVELRSTIRDITSAVTPDHPDWDPWPGDVRTATMRFDDRASSPPPACTPPAVAEVFDPFDVFDSTRNIGVGSCDWTAHIGSNDALTFEIGTVVAGNYTRNDGDDDTMVTIAKPLDDFITGGGYVDLERSAGTFAGAEGSRANFGFNVKFNKPRTNLQGNVNIIVRGDDGRRYQIKSNSLTSLGVDTGGRAQFESKANITDVTDSASPVSLGGGYVLQMLMTDVSQADGEDTIGFSLWDEQKTGNGPNAVVTRHLLFSSNWDGNQTIQQRLGGGNLVVHHR